MANATIYTADGLPGIKQLIASMVKDLTGVGTPIKGTAVPHMKLVYPSDGSLDLNAPADWADSTLVILEATTEIDPFADPNAGTLGAPVTNGTDPWRIAFHTHKWTGRDVTPLTVDSKTGLPDIDNDGNYQFGAAEADLKKVNSLAMYLGTPSTLAVSADGTTPTLGFRSTSTQKIPYYDSDYQDPTTQELIKQEFLYRSSYKNRDLIEPMGNTGAEWTNTFDPSVEAAKFKAGVAGYKSPKSWDGPDVTNTDQLFLNRYGVGGTTTQFGGMPIDDSYGQPISYRIVMTDHGLFIGCWGPDPEETGQGFSWMLCQRPVDKKTGIVRGINPLDGTPYTGTEVDIDGNLIPLGNRPLFCVNSVNGKFWKFVVREHDNPVPSSRKDAATNSIDSGAVINPYQQQSLTENGEYVITFLNNLNSSRFKYSDELDMLGTVSADVVGGGSQINVSVYSEEEKRAYHALWSSGSFGTKMRIMVVADVPTPNQPWVEAETPTTP